MRNKPSTQQESFFAPLGYALAGLVCLQGAVFLGYGGTLGFIFIIYGFGGMMLTKNPYQDIDPFAKYRPWNNEPVKNTKRWYEK